MTSPTAGVSGCHHLEKPDRPSKSRTSVTTLSVTTGGLPLNLRGELHVDPYRLLDVVVCHPCQYDGSLLR